MPDPNSDDVAEDLTINDQESVVEIILEQCMGIDNAIEEHDEPGDESQNLEIIKEFQLYTQSHEQVLFNHSFIELDIHIADKIIRLPSIVSDIIPPPPRA